MKKNKSIPGLVLCALLVTAWPSGAQSVRGSIGGRVTDASNQPLPNSGVTLVQEGPGGARSIRAGADGQFMVTLLPPGTYRIEAEIAGYHKSTRTVVLLV